MSSEEASYGDPQTRRRILQATWELIEELGSSFKLSDVADRGGVSRQAVYLHFGDRAGLLIAVVQYIDETLGLTALAAHIFDAPTGGEALQRMVEVRSDYASKIDPVAQVFDVARYQDEAIAAAWRDRMEFRRVVNRTIIQRIADEGQLAEGWTVDTAADVCYSVTMPGLWRELTRELGWTPEQYAENITRLLRRSLLAE